MLERILGHLGVGVVYDEDDLDNDEYYEEDDSPRRSSFFSKNSGSRGPSRPQTEIILSHPRNVDDARDICETVLNGKMSVFSIDGLDNISAMRITDFISGVIFSIDGSLQMISNTIFIACPRDVILSGDFQDILNKGM